MTNKIKKGFRYSIKKRENETNDEKRFREEKMMRLIKKLGIMIGREKDEEFKEFLFEMQMELCERHDIIMQPYEHEIKSKGIYGEPGRKMSEENKEQRSKTMNDHEEEISLIKPYIIEDYKNRIL